MIGMVIRIRAGRSGIQIIARKINFSLLQNAQNDPVVHPTSDYMRAEARSRGKDVGS